MRDHQTTALLNPGVKVCHQFGAAIQPARPGLDQHNVGGLQVLGFQTLAELGVEPTVPIDGLVQTDIHTFMEDGGLPGTRFTPAAGSRRGVLRGG